MVNIDIHKLTDITLAVVCKVNFMCGLHVTRINADRVHNIHVYKSF